ncbi:MAG: peroxiredoxin [Thermodesulfobacteriota bacterium]
MAKSLGIFVTDDGNMPHIMGIVKAATAKGSKVKIFFTWKGTRLARHPDFPALCAMAEVAICADSYGKMGYDKSVPPEGLTEKQMSTQAQHGYIIEGCDRYLTL